MKYRVKTERPMPFPVRRQVPVKVSTLPLYRPPSPYKPLEVAATPLDVVWSSLPVYDRAPAGWYRMGFCA